eukprot:s3721_g6.t1
MRVVIANRAMFGSDFCSCLSTPRATVSSLCSVTTCDHFAGSQQPELRESSNCRCDMMSSRAMDQSKSVPHQSLSDTVGISTAWQSA